MIKKILIADDHRLFRQGLKAIIEKLTDFEVVMEAINGKEALEGCKKFKPDLVIMDVTMPLMNGIEATRKIIEECENIRILALSAHVDRKFISEILTAGASGYLHKNCNQQELLDALEQLNNGNMYICPDLTGIVVQDFVQNIKENQEPQHLTSREYEVLQLVAEGLSTKEIAENLHLSIKTIETHRMHIMEKVNVTSVAALTKYAIREGITSLE
ncbi:response regulator [Candidatus Neomarinimicrobiota bacterium]